MDFDTVELEELDQVSEQAVVEIYQRFHQQRFQKGETVDHEYAILDGVVHIPRYHWSNLSENLLGDPSPASPKTLTVEQPGSLDSLKWIENDLPTLGRDEVEIDVKFVGLNFRVRHLFTSNSGVWRLTV
jgi:hypothetical protein